MTSFLVTIEFYIRQISKITKMLNTIYLILPFISLPSFLLIKCFYILKALLVMLNLYTKFGDLYGIRTHEAAVKGRCLNHLTNAPL